MFKLFGKKEVDKKVDSSIKEETLFKINRIEKLPVLPDFPNKEKIDIQYPLIEPYASVHIHWDPKEGDVIYEVIEPKLDDREKEVLKILENGVKEFINVSFISIKKGEAVIEYLERNIKTLLKELGLKISNDTFLKIMYYVYRDFVGMNEIEPLLCDYFIEDIECNGIKSPVYIVHRKYRNLRSNITFNEFPYLISFVEKLAQKAGRYVSYSNPILDGSLPDGSVEYNEPFIYKENGTIKISKIGAFIDKYYNKNESNIPKKSFNLEVPVFDEKYKIKWESADYVYRHKTKDSLFKINLETGKEITLSSSHSVFVLKDNGINTLKTTEIKEGDYVVIPTIIPEIEPIKEINLVERFLKSNLKNKVVIRNVPSYIFKEKGLTIKDYLKENYKKKNQSFYDFKNKNILPLSLYNILSNKELRNCKLATSSHQEVPTFLKIDKDLIRLVGYYTAEGWLTKVKNHHRIHFCLNINEKKYINEICKSFKNCFNVIPYLEKEYKNAIKITINSILIKHIFEEILEVTKYAKTKEVPWIIYNVSNKLKKEYIKTWSNGDYNCTASKKLISDLSYLSLFNEDILSICSRTRNGKIEERDITSTEFYSNEIIRNPIKRYIEMIPMEIFNPLNQMHIKLRNKRISKKRLLETLNDIRFQRFEKLNSNLPKQFLIEWSKRGFIKDNELTIKGLKALNEKLIVDTLINSDLGFAKIKKIQKTESNHEYVYDISVPNYENFISGLGGIFCHNSRVNATYTTDISSKGPTFTLRKFTKEPWSPVKMIDMRTVSPEILAYLWILIEHEFNVMVIGGTGSGKTTFLNGLAFFIPPQARIVSIEDTRELNLEHENWLPSVAREGIGLANIVGQKYGEVTLFDLLKESFRQRPDYVIVGEIRGQEAFVLFQGMSSGHPSMGTMHANDVESMIKRLESPPINLSATLVEALDVVCVIGHAKVNGQDVRRIKMIQEIISVGESGQAQINIPFKWDVNTDTFFFKTDSYTFKKLTEEFGFGKERLLEEFQLRTKLLVAMYKTKIFDYKQVQTVINEYARNPKKVLKQFGVI
ncbi:MAG: ATPase, T2SS/T4P/T4SS family [Candidatus Nanoarchaeia archaeon]|nr:ATPase, T2SS/T4P/T4SS family [Candidatus Nanoarchaeia archaeon]MDD5587558.1 ATPase, T2SS/T4P/T4SS family [Candidatus Nanoarchaeia archaeon]